MKTLSEVVVLLRRVEHGELLRWVERGWVTPSATGPAAPSTAEPAFSELDIARLQLICDLRHDLMVEDETIPLVLSLVDQLYALRRRVDVLAGAIRRQPPTVRDAIIKQLRQRHD